MRNSRLFAGAVVALLCSASVSAHRMDEYLQAARIGIEPGRVDLQLDLTPGMAVFESVIAAIDRDHDGVLSAVEQDEYVTAVFDAVALTVDGEPLRMHSITSTFPDVDGLRQGQRIIHLRATATLPALAHGSHQLTFRNSHRQDVSVYLANALVPISDAIAINAQHRDQAQVALAIDFTVASNSEPAPPALGLLAAAIAICAALSARATVGARA